MVISFGGDTLGGTVISYPAGGGQVTAGSATVSVSSDGLLTVTSPPSDVSIVFSYRIANDNGSDDARVTVVRTRPGGGGV